jgi:hypothetical protein
MAKKQGSAEPEKVAFPPLQSMESTLTDFGFGALSSKALTLHAGFE